MAITIEQLAELESGLIRTLQGGRIDRISDSVLEWQPHKHGTVGLWNGNLWLPITPTVNPQLLTSDLDIDGAALTADTNYDIFAEYYDEDTFKLVAKVWTGDNSHTVPRFNGVLVEDEDSDGYKRRYLGAVRLNSSGNFEDDQRRRFVVNWDHWVVKQVRVRCNTAANWNYDGDGAVVELRNGSNVERGEFICIHSGVHYCGGASIFRNQRGYSDEPARGRTDIGASMNTVANSSKGWWGYSDGKDYRIPATSITAIGQEYPSIGYNYVTITYRSWEATNVYCESGTYDGGAWLIQA